ncbi:RNA-binding protein [Schizosaccharomyces japonicus yFS275]|uniref:RNA-binding protein n=1 Tax=Schizosaccharomyces japonicus (strain yFS275 / FY16936) TaxID=402676 RepID=B6JVQ9_SCHJY|nr:RNA-binding protein [Schizosaccharomyces japonicus yFS275]EEB05460.1 RNA-binding protein [Schizosaccharomyces japonicus yFS275]
MASRNNAENAGDVQPQDVQWNMSVNANASFSNDNGNGAEKLSHDAMSNNQNGAATNPATTGLQFHSSNNASNASLSDIKSSDNMMHVNNDETASHNNSTLWMGELAPFITEAMVQQIWNSLGENVNVKIIRDRYSGLNAGYCFVEFNSPASAMKAMSLNGTVIPGTNRFFKLNWASGGGLHDRREGKTPEFSIFVGDLGPEVTEPMLLSLFQSRYRSCKSAKIMMDSNTNLSRGYGFVRFYDENDQKRALTEMQGVYCGNRPMRIAMATPKSKNHMYSPMNMMHIGLQPVGFYGAPQPVNQFTDPTNTTVFVGGLSGYVTEEELRFLFQNFGEIIYVKIPPGKGCGFVQFVNRQSAELAINQMQGYPLGKSRIRLSWGRSQGGNVGAPIAYRSPPHHAASTASGLYHSLGLPPQHQFSPYASVGASGMPIQSAPPTGMENALPPAPGFLPNPLYATEHSKQGDSMSSQGGDGVPSN